MSQIVRTLLAPGSRFGVLLASLILMMFLPFVLPERLDRLLTPVLFTVVLLSSLSAVADSRRHFGIGAALAVPTCALIIVSAAVETPWLSMTTSVFAIAFLGYVSILILAFVLRAREVDLGIVFGSVCVYLLVAFMWASGYTLIEGLQPGSFAIPSLTEEESTRNALQYFSFVTITTLGYGDIQPVTRLARMTSVLEAVIGQLYLVILVARLVGLHTALESAKVGSGE